MNDFAAPLKGGFQTTGIVEITDGDVRSTQGSHRLFLFGPAHQGTDRDLSRRQGLQDFSAGFSRCAR